MVVTMCYPQGTSKSSFEAWSWIESRSAPPVVVFGKTVHALPANCALTILQLGCWALPDVFRVLCNVDRWTNSANPSSAVCFEGTLWKCSPNIAERQIYIIDRGALKGRARRNVHSDVDVINDGNLVDGLGVEGLQPTVEQHTRTPTPSLTLQEIFFFPTRTCRNLCVQERVMCRVRSVTGIQVGSLVICKCCDKYQRSWCHMLHDFDVSCVRPRVATIVAARCRCTIHMSCVWTQLILVPLRIVLQYRVHPLCSTPKNYRVPWDKGLVNKETFFGGYFCRHQLLCFVHRTCCTAVGLGIA